MSVTVNDLAPVAFSVEQAALHLGLSVSLLNQLRCKGGGPSFAKLGRRVAYRKADLDEWLASRMRNSTSDAGEA
jgi:predicted DNA-binding transcriptional regulator AlpA